MLSRWRSVCCGKIYRPPTACVMSRRLCDSAISCVLPPYNLRWSAAAIRIHMRAAERVLADQSRADREIISRLWDVLDDLSQPSLGAPTEFPNRFRTVSKETLTP